MAALSPIDEVVQDFSIFEDVLDEDILDVLRQYDRLSKGELIDELVENCDKGVLSEARLKIFDVAKDKVAKRIGDASVGKNNDPEHNERPQEGTVPLSKRFVDQWDPVARRKPQKFANDIVDLIGYVLGHDPLFPAHVVREASLDKGSLEGLRKYCGVAEANLLRELNESNGQVLVEVVTKNANSETHLVTIPGEVLDGSVHLDIPIESLTEVSTSSDTGDNHTPVTSTVPRENGIQEASVKSTPKATPSALTTRKKLVNMATQTDLTGDGFRPVSRTEFEYHADYIERVCRETSDKLKRINEWQRGMEKRVAAVEYNDGTLSMSMQCDSGPTQASAKKSSAVPPASSARLIVKDVPPEQIKQKPKQNAQGTGRKNEKGKVNNDQRILRSNSRSNEGAVATTSDCARAPPRQNNNGRPRETVNVEYEVPDSDYNPYSPLETESEPTPTRPRGRGRGLPRRDTMSSEENRPRTTASRNSGRQQPVAQAKQSRVEVPMNTEPPVGTDSPGPTSESDTSNTYDSWYEEVDDEVAQPSKKRMTCDNTDKRDWPADETAKRNSSTPKPTSSMQQKQRPDANQREYQKRSNVAKIPTRTSGQTVLAPNPKGEMSVIVNTALNEGRSDDTGSETYADKAKQGEWEKPKNKKRKYLKPHSKKIPLLKAVSNSTFKDIYVQELDYSMCKTKEDLEAIVAEHCRVRGVKAYDLNTIPVKGTKVKAGCKVTVLSADYDDLLDDDFWPEGASVRPWRTKPKSDDENDEKHENAN